MLTLLTPTRHRPDTFARTEAYIREQDYKGEIQWIVVNDGSEHYHYTMGQIVIQRSPTDSKRHSLCENYLAAIPHIKDNKIICVDDDDYYCPEYLSQMSRALDRSPLVGLAPARYYHLPERRWRILTNKHYASLAATGFTREVLPTFEQGCKVGNPYIDGWLWTHWHNTLRHKAEIMPNAGQQIGLKDGTGIGTGHQPVGKKDQTAHVLRLWLTWKGTISEASLDLLDSLDALQDA